MRWAFWRSGRRRAPAEERALPEDVGLPTAPSRAAGAAFRDEVHEPPQLTAQSPFSGASPGASPADVRREPGAAVADPPPLDPSARQEAATAVAAAVRGVLAGDAPAVDRALSPLDDQPTGTRGASSLAAHALAARLPALSGVSGAVVFDEPAGELLHAYADLLSERAEPLRRKVAAGLRDETSAVAHLVAGAAAQEAEGGLANPQAAPARSSAPIRLVLPGLAPRQQLLATCVLLAQTCRDGGGDVDSLAVELRSLGHETPPG